MNAKTENGNGNTITKIKQKKKNGAGNIVVWGESQK